MKKQALKTAAPEEIEGGGEAEYNSDFSDSKTESDQESQS
jgi:hypothetical protein